jgi:hypothetical protein
MSENARLNALTERIIGAAISVHHAVGPGMLESAYDACLAYELIDRGLAIERQKSPAHAAQLRCYLGFSKCKVGLLINFNVKWLVKDGIKRIVNGFPE